MLKNPSVYIDSSSTEIMRAMKTNRAGAGTTPRPRPHGFCPERKATAVGMEPPACLRGKVKVSAAVLFLYHYGGPH